MIEEFNYKINKIWNEHSDIVNKLPLQIPQINFNPTVLFIGINPSHRKGSPEIKTLEQSRENEKKAKEDKEDPYFKPFSKFTNNWEHLDLFFIREKDQNKLKDYINFKEKEGIKLNDFGEKQLELSLSLIERIKPKVIVVNNALASRIIKDRLNLEFNKTGGYHLLNGIPIFFSGMLSGQRALDIGSLDRLVWHVQKVINQ